MNDTPGINLPERVPPVALQEMTHTDPLQPGAEMKIGDGAVVPPRENQSDVGSGDRTPQLQRSAIRARSSESAGNKKTNAEGTGRLAPAVPRQRQDRKRQVISGKRKSSAPEGKDGAVQSVLRTKVKTEARPSPDESRASVLVEKFNFATQERFARQLEMMMSTSATNAAKIQTIFADAQAAAQEAFNKSKASIEQAAEMSRSNVEAVAASAKILTTGFTRLGECLLADGRQEFAASAERARELAATTHPLGFFNWQVKYARDQFQAVLSQAAKNTDAVVKLANEAFAPIANRLNAAHEQESSAS